MNQLVLQSGLQSLTERQTITYMILHANIRVSTENLCMHFCFLLTILLVDQSLLCAASNTSKQTSVFDCAFEICIVKNLQQAVSKTTAILRGGSERVPVC